VLRASNLFPLILSFIWFRINCMRKEIRKERILRRKNFFPTLIIIILLWDLIAGFVYFIEPYTFGAVPLFFTLLFFAFLFTFSTIFANSRRGFITSLGLILFLFLRYLGIGNIINFLLILGLAISIEAYFYKNF